MKTVLESAKPALHEKRWAALAVLCTAQFVGIMDTSIIGVALPAIKESLGYSQAGLQWVFNAYVIFFGGLLLLGGRMSDLYGARKVFSWGFVVLSAASLLAGLAWSEASLNVGRALQGAGSALIAPASLTLLMMTFTDPKELGKAMGFWGASAAAGGSAGVFLGGVITEWLSWRWVFFVNIPLGIIVLLLTSSLLLPGRRQPGKLDLLGALVVTAAVVLAVYAIVTPDQTGWRLSVGGASLVLLILFIGLQRAAEHPLIPLQIFKVPNLFAANLAIALLAGAWIPLWFFLNLYLQQILGLPALYSGLALLPMTITIMILMVGFTGRLVGKFGYKANLVAGLLVLSASLLLFAQAPVGGSFWVHVLPASVLAAAGMSLAYIPGTIAAMSGAKPEETGLASGLVNTSYQLGSALGLAAMVALAGSTSSHWMGQGVAQVEALAGSTSSHWMGQGVAQVEALNAGFQSAFMGAFGLAFLGGILSLLLIKQFKS